MNLAIIGTGYVGLVTGACLADVGNRVTCVDRDLAKLELLYAGRMPIYEPGLDELVARNTGCGRLRFTSDLPSAVADSDAIFIAVGTPPRDDGAADLRYVLEAGLAIAGAVNRDTVLVVKSTVPVGTADRLRDIATAELARRGVTYGISVASNPEFLKEGNAIDDFQRPDRIVIGTADEQARRLLRMLYAPYNRNHDRLISMDIRSAEFTKYASNAMLATRISFMNELARIAEKVGADIEAVRLGAGSDPRIGHHFLYAGAGYGGSCLPKDVRALIRLAADHGEPAEVLNSVLRVNESQKQISFEKIRAFFGGDLQGHTVAIWGLAFKPETDDIREAPALDLIDRLLAHGARIQAYDPVAATNASLIVQHRNFHLTPDADAACRGADLLAVMTEWREFKSPDFSMLAKVLKNRAIFDARNLYDPEYLQGLGLQCLGIGRSAAALPASEGLTAR